MVKVVGRTRELERLEELIDRTTAGTSQAAVIEGEPGIGKSRLVEEVCALAESRGLTVLSSTGQEFQRGRPFAAIVEAIDLGSERAGRAAVVDLMQEAPASVGADHRYRIVEAIEDAIEQDALRSPVLLAVDDAHWADSSSLLALHALSRRTDLPLFLLVSARAVPRSEEFRTLLNAIGQAGAERLPLNSLDGEQVARLAEERLGAVPGPRLREQLARTAGNPLFVLELLDGLTQEQQIQVADGAAELEELRDAPPSVQSAIVRRLEFLGERTVELLRSAAVLGQSFAAADLAAVSDAPLTDVLATLKEPIAGGFLTAAGHSLAFRHDVVREALYNDVPPAVRKGLHLHIGRTLAGAGAPPIRVAPHFAAGAEVGDREAVGWLRRAAMDVAAQAPDLAVDLMDRAAKLLPPGDPELVGLLFEQVTRLLYSGKLDRAERVADQLEPVIRGTPLGVMLELQRLGLMGLQFRLEEMGERADELLGGEPLVEDFRAQIAAVSAGTRFAGGDVLGSLQRIEEARAYTERNRSSVASGITLWVTAGVSQRRGLFAEFLEMVGEAVKGTDLFVGGRGQGLAVLGMGQCVGADLYDASRATLDLARREYETRGALAFIVECQWFVAHLEFVTGRWDDAITELVAVKQLPEETGVLGTGNAWIPNPLTLIQLFRGDPESAARTLATSVPKQGNVWVASHWNDPIRALLEDAVGRTELAQGTVRAWQRMLCEYDFVPDLRVVGRPLVQLCRAPGTDDLLAQLASHASLAFERAGGLRSAEGAALLVQGAVRDDPELLLQAVETLRGASRPFDLAEACAETGLCLMRRRDKHHGRSLLMEAFSLYESMGAVRREADLAKKVREFGIRRGARQRRGRPELGWDSLTDSERKVISLVVEGLTNREIGSRLFIAKGTVATHLRNVFRKLGVASRAELAGEAVRQAGERAEAYSSTEW